MLVRTNLDVPLSFAIGSRTIPRPYDEFSLGSNATQGQLQKVFSEEYNVNGSTQRKAIAFFLGACKFAGVEVSKHFKTPKVSSSPRKGGKGNKGGKGKGEDDTQLQNPPPPTPPPTPEAPMLILGLLKQLPPEGSKWDRNKAKHWLGIAEMTFEMVYDFDGPAETDLGPNGVGGDLDP